MSNWRQASTNPHALEGAPPRAAGRRHGRTSLGSLGRRSADRIELIDHQQGFAVSRHGGQGSPPARPASPSRSTPNSWVDREGLDLVQTQGQGAGQLCRQLDGLPGRALRSCRHLPHPPRALSSIPPRRRCASLGSPHEISGASSLARRWWLEPRRQGASRLRIGRLDADDSRPGRARIPTVKRVDGRRCREPWPCCPRPGPQDPRRCRSRRSDDEQLCRAPLLVSVMWRSSGHRTTTR